MRFSSDFTKILIEFNKPIKSAIDQELIPLPPSTLFENLAAGWLGKGECS
jgi:hypothetical protein